MALMQKRPQNNLRAFCQAESQIFKLPTFFVILFFLFNAITPIVWPVLKITSFPISIDIGIHLISVIIIFGFAVSITVIRLIPAYQRY